MKARLLAEPEQVIREQGGAVLPGQRLTAVEVGPHETYIVLGSEPATTDLAEDPWGRVWQRVAADPAYRERLVQSPSTALAEENITIPAGQLVRTVEADDAHGFVFVLAKPDGLAEETLSDDDVAGYFCFCNVGPPPAHTIGYLPQPHVAQPLVYMPARSIPGWPPR